MSSRNACIIASPVIGTYDGVLYTDILSEYALMSTKDFDAQFTPVEGANTEPSEETILSPYNFQTHLKSRSLIKKQTCGFDIAKWQKVPVNASIYSSIYALPDGYPLGEVVFIENRSPEVNITGGLMDFYKSYGWLAKKYDSVPIKTHDDVLLGELFGLSKEKISKLKKHGR